MVTSPQLQVHTQASKRPLSTLLLQMAAQEEAAGRAFDEVTGAVDGRNFLGKIWKNGGFMWGISRNSGIQ